MSAENSEAIRAVDPTDYLSADPDRRQNFIDELGAGFRDTGFLFVKTPDFVDEMSEIYESFGRVFDLPEDTKKRYERAELHHQRGYTPPRHETGVSCRGIGPDGSDMPDAKENWFIGPEDYDDPEIAKEFPELCATNIWPEEVPEFKQKALRLYTLLNGVGRVVLSATGEYLRQASDESDRYDDRFFEQMIKDGPTSLRPLHYPPITPDDVGKIVWGCAHTDINLATVLPPASRSGLRVQTRSGTWVPGKAPEGHSIAQVGDMLQQITAGHFLSAVHEVVAPNEPTIEGRYSAALFMHASPKYLLRPDLSLAEENVNPEDYSPITAADYLYKRLAEIGLAASK